MIETTHDHCTTCDWLAREAERTALAEGTDYWTSETVISGVFHVAHFEAVAR